jgi:hypothetical protein
MAEYAGKNGAFDARTRFGKAIFSGIFDAMSTFYTNLADGPSIPQRRPKQPLSESWPVDR